MERLRRADLVALLDGIQEIATPRTVEAFPAAAIALARRLVPGVCHGYTAIDVRRRQTTIVIDPGEAKFPGGEELFVRHAPDHPLIARFADEPAHAALTISDFLSRRAFHRLGLYADLYRRIDTEDQLAIGLPSPPAMAVGIVVNRGREGFTGRDGTLFNLARPHLAQAYRNAQAITTMHAALAASERPALALDAASTVRSAPDRAWQLLGQYCGAGATPGRLPERVERWVRAQRDRLRCDDAPPPLAPLELERDGRRLTIRLFTGPSGTGEGLLVLDEGPPGLSAERMAPLGLSWRECEVLLCVTRGGTNPEIAALLNISTRTVQKHLEHIYAKLGVAGRAEATARAFSLL